MGWLDSFMPGESAGIPSQANPGWQGLLNGDNAMLNAGLGILANNYGHYGAFGPAVGLGLQQGIQNTQQAQQLAQRKKLYDLQMQQEQQRIADQQRKQLADKSYSDAISKAFVPASSQPNMSFMEANNQAVQPQGLLTNPSDMANPQVLPQPQTDYQWNQTAPTFDKQAMLNAVLQDPNIEGTQKFAAYQAMQKDNSPIKVGKDDRLLSMNPDGTYKTLIDALPDPSKDNTPSAVREYQFAKGQGYPGSYLDFQLAQKKAGASSTNIKIDNKTGEGLAKEVGPMVAASKSAAEGAIQQADIANRINSAIDSGKIITGPGTDARLKLLQIGNTLGINGKDNNETLTNTRTAIQGLSQFTLSGRSALKGQGQISDYEGKLLAKATSGDLSDLTTPELKVITKAAQRVADAQYKMHQKNMSVMRSKPELSSVADFYDVGALPDNQSASTPTQNYPKLPPNPTAKSLQKGTVYATPKGNLRWNGLQFEDVQ